MDRVQTPSAKVRRDSGDLRDLSRGAGLGGAGRHARVAAPPVDRATPPPHRDTSSRSLTLQPASNPHPSFSQPMASHLPSANLDLRPVTPCGFAEQTLGLSLYPWQ